MAAVMKAVRVSIDWHPGLPIYASESFLRSVGDEYGWIGGMGQSGTLRCIVPFVVLKKVTVRMARFMVETIPWIPALSVEEERDFLNNAMDYFRSIGVDLVIPAPTSAVFRTYPDGADAAPYGSYVVSLNQPEEILWKNVHSKHRNVIRNAARKGVVIRSGLQYLETAHRIISATLKRSKLSFRSYDSFKKFVDRLGENVKIFVADHEGVIQGCAVVPYSEKSAYYLYGGSISSPLSGATNLLQWEAMRTFKELGVSSYDFVGARINPARGSKQAGIELFKRRFGGRLVRGYLWKYAFHPLKASVYSIGVRLLRGGDIVDQERHKLAATSS